MVRELPDGRLPQTTAGPIPSRVLRTWLPPVGTCLLLQASLLGAGFLIHRCIEPPTPCCVSPLVL